MQLPLITNLVLRHFASQACSSVFGVPFHLYHVLFVATSVKIVEMNHTATLTTISPLNFVISSLIASIAVVNALIPASLLPAVVIATYNGGATNFIFSSINCVHIKNTLIKPSGPLCSPFNKAARIASIPS